ncbi:MAG: hypothetical protein Q9168_004404 [Polycauliona sp. 1 TL-2023]
MAITAPRHRNAKEEFQQYYQKFCHDNRLSPNLELLAWCYTSSREDHHLSYPAREELLAELSSNLKQGRSTTGWTQVLRAYCEDAAHSERFKECILEALTSDTKVLLALDRCYEFRKLKEDKSCAPHLVSLLLEAVHEVDRRRR